MCLYNAPSPQLCLYMLFALNCSLLSSFVSSPFIFASSWPVYFLIFTSPLSIHLFRSSPFFISDTFWLLSLSHYSEDVVWPTMLCSPLSAIINSQSVVFMLQAMGCFIAPPTGQCSCLIGWVWIFTAGASQWQQGEQRNPTAKLHVTVDRWGWRRGEEDIGGHEERRGGRDKIGQGGKKERGVDFYKEGDE